jgi:hypothetical protein
MRKNWQVSALTLAAVLGACGTQQDQTAVLSDDLKKDLAVAGSSGGDLAIAPQHYQRMRFVSGVEQFPSATPAKRPKPAHHTTHVAMIHRAAPAPTTAAEAAPEPTIAETPAPTPTASAESPAPEPTVVAESPRPAPAPASGAGGGPSEGAGDRGNGGGWGGLLGGIIGAVVIRGGSGGVDHCDPRSDGRMGRPTVDRPDFGLPLPTGGGVFGRGRQRLGAGRRAARDRGMDERAWAPPPGSSKY